LCLGERNLATERVEGQIRPGLGSIYPPFVMKRTWIALLERSRPDAISGQKWQYSVVTGKPWSDAFLRIFDIGNGVE
jgi:hypothetical protein